MSYLSKTVKSNIKRSSKEEIKNEKAFAKTITIRYTMSNTRNKEFVKIILLDTNDLKKKYNLDLFFEELSLLGFHTQPLKDKPNIIGLIKNDEKRKLTEGRLLLIKHLL